MSGMEVLTALRRKKLSRVWHWREGRLWSCVSRLSLVVRVLCICAAGELEGSRCLTTMVLCIPGILWKSEVRTVWGFRWLFLPLRVFSKTDVNISAPRSAKKLAEKKLLGNVGEETKRRRIKPRLLEELEEEISVDEKPKGTPGMLYKHVAHVVLYLNPLNVGAFSLRIG